MHASTRESFFPRHENIFLLFEKAIVDKKISLQGKHQADFLYIKVQITAFYNFHTNSQLEDLDNLYSMY